MLQAAAAVGGGLLSTGIHFGVLCRAAHHLTPSLIFKVYTKASCIPSAQYSSSSQHETWHYLSELQTPDLVIGQSNTSPQITGIFHKRADATPSNYTTAPFQDACTQLAFVAAQDSKWPGRSKAVLERVDKDLGGAWLLVQCGDYFVDKALVGKPARALVHVTMWSVEQNTTTTSSSSSSSEPKSKKKKKEDAGPELTLLLNAEATQFASPTSKPFVHYATYQLNADGWPTGHMYSSASQFEVQTTAYMKKPMRSFRVVHYGQVVRSIESWGKKNLAPGDFTETQDRSSRPTFYVNKAYKGLVQPLGVAVI